MATATDFKGDRFKTNERQTAELAKHLFVSWGGLTIIKIERNERIKSTNAPGWKVTHETE